MTNILFFFRKTIPGAYSINQIFNELAVEIGRIFNVRTYELNTAGASPHKIISNLAQAYRTAGDNIHHITGDVHYLVLGLRRGQSVLTIHDCVTLVNTPRWHPKFHILLWLWYKLPVKYADAVTTISEKSKDEIVAFTGCNPDKIEVIPNFVGSQYQYEPKTFNTFCPRILQIGIKPNKNLERVIEALSGISCILEIIGELKSNHLALLHKYRITYENHFALSQADLAERYRRADIVIFASTYEGFGMPVVEAQATGRPVVASNLSPMPWVAGLGGACFVNPFDPASIRAGVERVIGDETYRNELITIGLENIKRFSISRVAKSYMEVYQRLQPANNQHLN